MSSSSTNAPIDLGADEGFVVVKIGGEEKRLDVWAVCWRLSEAYAPELSATEYNQRVLAIMRELGYQGEVSANAVDRFAVKMQERGRELQKKEPASASPASPGSTEPPCAL